jgi:hypothetical protein
MSKHAPVLDSPARAWLDRMRGRSLTTAPLDVLNEDQGARPPGQFDVGEPSTQRLQRVSATDENDVTVTVFSSVNCLVQFGGIIKRPNGQTQPIGSGGNGYQLSVIGDRVPRAVTFTRGSGVEPIGYHVQVVSPIVLLGSVWVIVQQSRTLPDGSRVITNTYLSGPVSDVQPIGWPGSPVQASTTFFYPRSLTGTTPAAGAEINESVPAGARWEVQVFRYILNTDPTVINRVSEWTIRTATGVLIFFSSMFPNALGGSAIAGWNWAEGSPIVNDPSILGFTGPLPFGLILGAGLRVGTITTGFQAGDQYSQVQYIVKEALDP